MSDYRVCMSNKKGYVVFEAENRTVAVLKAADALKMLKGTEGTVSVSDDTGCRVIVTTKALKVLAGEDKALGEEIIAKAKRK